MVSFEVFETGSPMDLHASKLPYSKDGLQLLTLLPLARLLSAGRQTCTSTLSTLFSLYFS